MSHSKHMLVVLIVILVSILALLFAPSKSSTAPEIAEQISSNTAVLQKIPPVAVSTHTRERPVRSRRNTPPNQTKQVALDGAPSSTYEQAETNEIDIPVSAGTPVPPPPEYAVPEGPNILPLSFVRLTFKGAPEGEALGLGLYLKLIDADQKKLARLKRREIEHLAAFLASQYRFDRVQTDLGKHHFIGLLETRIRGKLRHIPLHEVGIAFFEGYD